MSAFAIPVDASESFPSGVSRASEAVQRQWTQARQHFVLPVTRRTIEQQFQGLAETWKEEVGSTSSMTDLVLSPSYQRIIGLGPKVIPSILVELSRRPDHWFSALAALTGVNPISENAAGDLDAMTKAWLRWGDEQGYLD
jgi:hypothetical protein